MVKGPTVDEEAEMETTLLGKEAYLPPTQVGGPNNIL